MNDYKQIILFGAGRYSERALHFFGVRNVYCFADNLKGGTTHLGKKVITFEELLRIHTDYQVVLSVGPMSYEAMAMQLEAAGIEFGYLGDIYCKYMKNSSRPNPRVERWKNAYCGNKIFLIGNGPSLNASDLDKIQKSGHLSMGCNFINKIFEKTVWRPDFYCCCEITAVVENIEFIRETNTKAKFIIDLSETKYSDLISESTDNDICLLNYIANHLWFSDDPARVVSGGYSVMSTMIELAMYMGFSEIYLLGVDNTQPPTVFTADFMKRKNHFYEESSAELQNRQKIFTEYNSPASDDWSGYKKGLDSMYCIARDCLSAKKVKIFNATRGGNLEVFERVDFDGLFEEHDNV
jgi:hypothetical protein